MASGARLGPPPPRRLPALLPPGSSRCASRRAWSTPLPSCSASRPSTTAPPARRAAARGGGASSSTPRRRCCRSSEDGGAHPLGSPPRAAAHWRLFEGVSRASARHETGRSPTPHPQRPTTPHTARTPHSFSVPKPDMREPSATRNGAHFMETVSGISALARGNATHLVFVSVCSAESREWTNCYLDTSTVSHTHEKRRKNTPNACHSRHEPPRISRVSSR